MDDDYAAALDGFIAMLEAAGASVDRQTRPAFDFHRANDLMNLLVRAETSTRLDDSQYLENEALAGSDGAGIERFVYLNARGNAMPHRHWLNLHERRLGICAVWWSFFRSFDLFLCPGAANAAAPFGKASKVEQRTILVNGLEQPVLSQHFWYSFASLAYLPAYADHDVAAASGLFSDLMVHMDR